MRCLNLFLLPVVLACTSPDSDTCASYMSANAATASAFCNTFTKSTVTATTALPAWASNCSNKPSALSKECSCYFTAGAAAATTAATTTAKAATSPGAASSKTSSAAGTSATNTCGSAAVNGLVGYGSGAKGGGSGSGTTVTSCSALSAAAAKSGVITISGTLTGCGIIDLQSDTTVLGVGASSGLTNGGFRIKGQESVILRNLVFHDPPESKDLVEIQSSTYVWVDHCDFSTDGITGDKDYYDGLLDITHGSDYVTASWNVFHDHWKGSLIGHSDSNAAEDTGHLRVTYHHNVWSNINSRLPSIRFGTAHIYSSCYENNPTSGINSRMGAQVLVEQNYFLNTKLAIVTDLDSENDGYAVDENNVYASSTKEITQVGSLTPPYSYTLDPASCVCALLAKSAGTGVIA